MPRKWSNLNLPGALHFVTGATIDRVPVFVEDTHCAAFFEVLAQVSRDWPCKLIAYVVMPDHMHLVCNPRDGRIKEFTAALKSLSAKQIYNLSHDARLIRHSPDSDGSTHQLWQESFKALPLWSGGWCGRRSITFMRIPLRRGFVRRRRIIDGPVLARSIRLPANPLRWIKTGGGPKMLRS